MRSPMVTGICNHEMISIQMDMTHYPIHYFQLFIDNIFIGSYYPTPQFQLRNEGYKKITVLCVLKDGTQHLTHISCAQRFSPWHHSSRSFQPGDILVACDNVNGLPPGYMGHSAIVVDEHSLIEAVTTDPQIRKYPIDQFLKEHPTHAHYRCTNPQLARMAKEFAESFLLKYNENLQNGVKRPIFSFTTDVPLDDPWHSIYCSKLVWLSYYYGAGLKFENDYFVFAPEDLAKFLDKDPNFQVIYKHSNFHFKIDL